MPKAKKPRQIGARQARAIARNTGLRSEVKNQKNKAGVNRALSEAIKKAESPQRKEELKGRRSANRDIQRKLRKSRKK